MLNGGFLACVVLLPFCFNVLEPNVIKMSNLFGIYVGNSTASIAINREGKVDILANEAGDRVTRAVVSLSHHEKDVGPTSTSFSKASCTVTNNKALLDNTLSSEELERHIKLSTVPISTEDGLFYTISEEDKKPITFTPSQIAVLIFKKLYNIGAGATGQRNLQCVLCVPYQWDDESRRVYEESAEEAGWKVLQVINEHPAALLAHRVGFEKPPQDMNVLVYRLGGISCDASVIRLESGLFSVLSTARKDIGGEAMVKLLTQHLAEEFSRKYYLEPRESRKSMWKLRTAAQGILHSLSTGPSCSRFVESVCEGVDFNVSVSLARFNSLLAPLLQDFTAPIHQALDSAILSTSDISKVVLCGGCLKVPKIRSYVSSFFDCETLNGIPPDEVLAVGAAEQALLVSTLIDKLDSSTTLPFLASTVNIKLNEEEIRLEKGLVPQSKHVTLQVEEGPISVTATQDSAERKATLMMENSETLDVKIIATLEKELLIEAQYGNTEEMKKTLIDFQNY